MQRREKEVIDLHKALVGVMNFVPHPPISERRWIWRGAEQLGTLAKRLQDYLSELTSNGQWVWEESKVLRHFLQIPITSEKRQAREVLMNEIRARKQQPDRNALLNEIRSGRAGSTLRRTTSGGESPHAPSPADDASATGKAKSGPQPPRTSVPHGTLGHHASDIEMTSLRDQRKSEEELHHDADTGFAVRARC